MANATPVHSDNQPASETFKELEKAAAERSGAKAVQPKAPKAPKGTKAVTEDGFEIADPVGQLSDDERTASEAAEVTSNGPKLGEFLNDTKGHRGVARVLHKEGTPINRPGIPRGSVYDSATTRVDW